MWFKTYLISLLTAKSVYVNACGHHGASSPSLALGDDGPADVETLGYTVNHFALLTHNVTATKQFYGKVLGMRTVFSYGAGTPYEVLYMGYSHGGKNGTGFQTGEELFAQKNNIEGMIEFLYVEDCGQTANFTPSTQRINSFSHIGLIVPDINATQARLEQYGARILKPANEPISVESSAAKAFGFASNTAAARKALKGVQGIGFDSFILAADPDGNMLEIQPQVPQGL